MQTKIAAQQLQEQHRQLADYDDNYADRQSQRKLLQETSQIQLQSQSELESPFQFMAKCSWL